jgi:hypothetical protein
MAGDVRLHTRSNMVILAPRAIAASPQYVAHGSARSHVPEQSRDPYSAHGAPTNC